MEKNTYPVESWKVTEKKFLKEWNYRNETTFALSNGYIGTRGTFDEGYPFTVDEGLEGNFINGFYESENIRYGEWNFGFPKKSQSLLNLPNLKKTTLIFDDEPFDLFTGEIKEYERSLLMEDGEVIRNVYWKSPKGKEVKVTFKRLVSFSDKNLMGIQIKFTPLNFSGKVKINSFFDGAVENHTSTTNPLIDYGPYGKHLIPRRLDVKGDTLIYEAEVKNNKFTMVCGSVCKCGGEITDKDIQEETAVVTYQLDVTENEEYAFEKIIAYSSDLDMDKDKLYGFIQEKLEKGNELGFDGLEKLQKEYMQEFWKKADIKIEGDDQLQQGIRFNLFHIMQSAGRDGRTGMGAKGLSGEGYEGHYFWDTEMYVLPVFIYTDAELAKQLLTYRYDTLDAARDRARILGHTKGALYPWRTINGEEASTYFPLGTAQYHINGDIAYAYKLYFDITGDYDFLIEKGAEVLIETARVWADVGCFAECKDNKYCICAVTGPDEYNAIVDNNFYTNLIARENLRSAVWALNKVKELDKEAYNKLVKKLDFSEDEVEYWERIIENMYFPYDEKLQIYPQDDGFLMRKPWDESKIPEEKRHLLYENYHPLFVYRQKMAKQADAILGMLLYSNYFTNEELKRNYDFYQTVTLHHSSLSTCIFGILASQIGYDDEAYKYFSQSATMDLEDMHNNFYAGIHAANMAGTWQGIVFGFAGVRSNRGYLEINPKIPNQWNSYEFNIQYKGSDLSIKITKEDVTYQLLNDVEISFESLGESLTLKKGEKYVQKI